MSHFLSLCCKLLAHFEETSINSKFLSQSNVPNACKIKVMIRSIALKEKLKSIEKHRLYSQPFYQLFEVFGKLAANMSH